MTCENEGREMRRSEGGEAMRGGPKEGRRTEGSRERWERG